MRLLSCDLCPSLERTGRSRLCVHRQTGGSIVIQLPTNIGSKTSYRRWSQSEGAGRRILINIHYVTEWINCASATRTPCAHSSDCFFSLYPLNFSLTFWIWKSKLLLFQSLAIMRNNQLIPKIRLIRFILHKSGNIIRSLFWSVRVVLVSTSHNLCSFEIIMSAEPCWA